MKKCMLFVALFLYITSLNLWAGNILLFNVPRNKSPFLNLEKYQKYKGTIMQVNHLKTKSQSNKTNKTELLTTLMSFKIIGIMVGKDNQSMALLQSPDNSVFLIKQGSLVGAGIYVKNITLSGVTFSLLKGKTSKSVVLYYNGENKGSKNNLKQTNLLINKFKNQDANRNLNGRIPFPVLPTP